MTNALQREALDALGIKAIENPCVSQVDGADMVCPNPDEYFFYDKIHPAGRMHYLWGIAAAVLARNPEVVLNSHDIATIAGYFNISHSSHKEYDSGSGRMDGHTAGFENQFSASHPNQLPQHAPSRAPSASFDSEKAAFKVQISNIDSYMATPTPADCLIQAPYNVFEEPLKQVPVIRIFGATKSEQKICLHVHQVWPYMYVQYDGAHTIEAVREFGYHLGLSLNHALDIALRTSNNKHVVSVIPVKGVPFYGYHTGYRPFLKIQLSNPYVMTRASSLLSSGAVMGRKMDVFGSHLSYISQFMVDFNLYGMGWISLRGVLFRTPLPKTDPHAAQPNIITDDTVPNSRRWVPHGMPSYLVKPTPPERISRCELEADVTAEDILNRMQVPERHIHHVFREGRLGLHFGRLVHSLDIVWEDENRRRREIGLDVVQPRNSDLQAALEKSLEVDSANSTDDVETNDAGHKQWSNYWRMQSLLQSALAIDKYKCRRLLQKSSCSAADSLVFQATTSPSQSGSAIFGDTQTSSTCNAVFSTFRQDDSWLLGWPTCREVDVGRPPMITNGEVGTGTSFYICQLESHDSSPNIDLQASGSPVDLTSSSPNASNSPRSSFPNNTQSQRLDPLVVIDVSIINNMLKESYDLKPGASFQTGFDTGSEAEAEIEVDAEAGVEDEDEVRVAFESDGDNLRIVKSKAQDVQPVPSVIAPRAGGCNAAEQDVLDMLDDIDDEWINSEISKAAHQDGAWLEERIPQLDGADDRRERDTNGKIQKSSRHSETRRAQHRRRHRVLIPLHLVSSSGSDDVESASAAPHRPKSLRSARPSETLRLKPITSSRSVPAGSSHLDVALPKGKADALQPACRPSVSKNKGALKRSISKERRPAAFKTEVYVDIPHANGEALGYIKRRARLRRIKSRPYVEIVVSAPRNGPDPAQMEDVESMDVDCTDEEPSDVQYMCSSKMDWTSCTSSSDAQSAPKSLLSITARFADGFYVFGQRAPTICSLTGSLEKHGIPEVVAPRPLVFNTSDLPRKRTIYSGVEIKHAVASIEKLPIFDPPRLASSGIRQHGLSKLELLDAQRTLRREAMWNSVAVQRINGRPSSRFVKSEAQSSEMHSGWWVFSKRPPVLTASNLNPCSPREDRDLGFDRSRGDTSIPPTPVHIRQRDQSDLKWSSVLGTLSIPNSGISTPKKTQFTPANPKATELDSQHTADTRMVFMSQVCLELLASCRDDSLPDPKLDSILFVVACLIDSEPQWGDDRFSGCTSVVWTWGPALRLDRLGFPSHVEHRHHSSEKEMISDIARWVCVTDPDVLCGYEVQNGSWGYLIDRSALAYGLQLEGELSRVAPPPRWSSWKQRGSDELARNNDTWGRRKGAAIKIAGRHVLNVWRLMRGELSLTSYSLENIAHKVLEKRIPRYPHHQLAQWYVQGPVVSRIRALRHVHFQTRTAMQILDKAGIVMRASEFASVIGIDFASVLTRGSQLRVESMMGRIAHPELFVLTSPTREQVAQQRAAECLPLVLEPQSKYYTDPVVVLDFQSLYPSVMIAYNYCYSTCLGSLEDLAGATDASEAGSAYANLDGGADNKRHLGFTSVSIPPGMLTALKNHVTVSPNGILFVKPAVRRGLLGRMLQELLESRVMIKDAMKRWGASDEALHKKLDAWQLGLKLIANVTYGYTGASFSGRMPCVEIADAIVQSGRETLERAIRFIHAKPKEWGARVVYGDTDSLFIHFPGKSRESAFRIGSEIAAAVTQMNPAPVKLKFEKVYQPCILLTKKRYAGWMYTTPEQTVPQLDVKGMELVRRDGCSATQRILEGVINTLFETNNLTRVRSFINAELTRVFKGDVPLQEFIIAKEVRLGGYSARVLPAHAKVAVDAMQIDARAEAQYGERVPYVVVSNARSSRLTDQVIHPRALLKQPELRLDYQYYVDKQIIPALDRVLSLVGVDVRAWAADMPRHLRSGFSNAIVDYHSGSEDEGAAHGLETGHSMLSALGGGPQGARRTLDHFYQKSNCILCRQALAPVSQPPGQRKGGSLLGIQRMVCNECAADKGALSANISSVRMRIGSSLKAVLERCVSCVGEARAGALMAVESCGCLDCPDMFLRTSLGRQHVAWSRIMRHEDF
ncbi:DNA polymerase zeta [Coemansia sp. Benny D115]|nr:DNA polymerase zeta [Coemansia sp. Benny D115]